MIRKMEKEFRHGLKVQNKKEICKMIRKMEKGQRFGQSQATNLLDYIKMEKHWKK